MTTREKAEYIANSLETCPLTTALEQALKWAAVRGSSEVTALLERAIDKHRTELIRVALGQLEADELTEC